MNLGYRFKIIIKTPEDGQLWFSRIFICFQVIQYIKLVHKYQTKKGTATIPLSVISS